MQFSVSPTLAKIILRVNFISRLKVMCRGYSEDLENFTELVWEDDMFLNFKDRATYQEFQLWFNI